MTPGMKLVPEGNQRLAVMALTTPIFVYTLKVPRAYRYSSDGSRSLSHERHTGYIADIENPSSIAPTISGKSVYVWVNRYTPESEISTSIESVPALENQPEMVPTEKLPIMLLTFSTLMTSGTEATPSKVTIITFIAVNVCAAKKYALNRSGNRTSMRRSNA